jgi:hypothetical protein
MLIFKRKSSAYSFKYVWLATLFFDDKTIEVCATPSLKYMIFDDFNSRVGWKKGINLFKELKENAERIEIHPEFYRMLLNEKKLDKLQKM